MSRITRRATGGIAAFLTLVLASSVWLRPSYAGDMTFPGPYANGTSHTYYIAAGIPTAQVTAFKAAMNYLASATDMTTGTAAAGISDIYFQAGIYSNAPYNSWYAWTSCSTFKSGSTTICNNWVVTRNNKLAHSNEQAVDCHEIGHTLGFNHAPPGDANKNYTTANRTCMRGDPDVTKYATADISKINARY